jgi:hypothetical protein
MEIKRNADIKPLTIAGITEARWFGSCDLQDHDQHISMH